MSNYDERLAALEHKVAAIELHHLHLAQENIPPAQGRNLREANENITILLGIAFKHNERIKAVEDNLNNFKEHVDRQFTGIKQDIGELDIKFGRLEQRFTALEDRFVSLEDRFVSLEGRFVSLEGRFEQRFVSLEGKFDQVLQIVTSLSRAINE